MESEGSFSRLQVLTTGPYPEPDKSSYRPLTLFRSHNCIQNSMPPQQLCSLQEANRTNNSCFSSNSNVQI
jgi:hypothetical protein